MLLALWVLVWWSVGVRGQCVWNYANPNADWPKLACAQTCGGSLQSPVNVASYLADRRLGPLAFAGYGEANFTLINKGYTIEVEMPEDYEGSFAEGYRLSQYHFHTPAENTLSGREEAMTMHCVHKNTNQSPVGIKVLTFLIEMVEAPDNPWLAPIVASIPLVRNISAVSRVPISMGGLGVVLDGLGHDHYVNFLGSLTTPPCTEGVDWYLMLHPFTVSRAQFEVFRSVMGSNNRPVQRNLYNVSAFIRQAPTPTPTPAPAPSPIPAQVNLANVQITYMNGFWVVLVLLMIVTTGLVVSLVYLKRALNPPVVID
eukprot:TRINITY_DN8470_c0_g1_i1.p1 TRINITY_DN8470_c0_g1~~TRINITY_DN8470_c0_g1_i1.p1  ORF type:complete len:314 (+),score=45.30 TRINITY_DN8470_c0_g1_i1:59-1000(+)